MKTGSKGSGGANADTKSRSGKVAIKPYTGMDPKKTWAVVKFNEEKRVFDTGNIKKFIGDDPKVRAKLRSLFLPSSKDLDAVAEEERIKWLTRK